MKRALKRFDGFTNIIKVDGQKTLTTTNELSL